jgi:hypothetical protein
VRVVSCRPFALFGPTGKDYGGFKSGNLVAQRSLEIIRCPKKVFSFLLA